MAGKPLNGRRRKSPSNAGMGAAYQWLLDHVGYQGDDCLPWPFSRDDRVGRGRIGYKGRQYWAHRLMCELAHGPAPSDRPQAAHECGKGHYGCVNPRHLKWKTNSANQLDRRKSGNMLRNPHGLRGALTAAQKAQIVALKGQKTQVEIAKQFGVSLGCVQYWHKWRSIRGNGEAGIHVYTPDEDDRIRKGVANSASFEDLAAELSVAVGSVTARAYRIGARRRKRSA